MSVSAVAIVLWLGGFASAEEKSSCVNCHKTMEGVAYLEHNFSDWEQSVHAQAGIKCETCHGGNPAAKDKTQAHRGVLSSKEIKSPVYFTRVPATCGACHDAEFKAFKKSAHYKELMRSGLGPNCVTCHGSMANRILGPRDLEMTCTLCHRRPTQAYATLMSLNNLKSSIAKLRVSLDEAKTSKVDVVHQEDEYRKIGELYRGALQAWHTFDMQSVLKTSQELSQRVKTALSEIDLKEKQK